jgi:hypothetical protein
MDHGAFYCVWWCATFLAAHGGVKDATPPPPVNPLYANAVKKRNFAMPFIYFM